MPINIASNLPIINKYQYPFNEKEDAFIESEIQNLLKEGVIRNSSHEPGEFISPIFLREKSDGGYRLILNLKKLKESVEYKKFKMETLATIIQLIRPNMFVAKLEINDTYYSIPIYEPHQKFLKSEYKSRLFKFMVLPNGYTEGPRKFTKLLKPPLSLLRKLERVLAASYFDDLMTMDCSYSACSNNIMKIIKQLSSLGLIVHPSKSVLFPCQEIEYLGFIINSTNMTLILTLIKKQKILLSSPHVKIRNILQLLGKSSSSFIVVPQRKLYYRSLEMNKTSALKINKGNFDKFIILSKESKANIYWWKSNIMDSFAPILRPNPSIVLNTDASLAGCSASMAGSNTGGTFFI